MMNRGLVFSLLLCVAEVSMSTGFVLPQQYHKASVVSALSAKKKKGKAGKGFGKKVEPKKVVASGESPASTVEPMSSTSSAVAEQGFIQGIESGGSSSIPQIDESIPADERAQKLLREKYGMRTAEEQRMEENIKEQRQKIDEWKKMADEGKDIDIMTMIPAPLLSGIDKFLKFGVAISMTLFVLAGIGITIEAWSVTSGNALPEDLNTFIVDIIEPNFTLGLGIVLAFSVSLGVFAAAQLASGSATYKEE